MCKSECDVWITPWPTIVTQRWKEIHHVSDSDSADLIFFPARDQLGCKHRELEIARTAPPAGTPGG